MSLEPKPAGRASDTLALLFRAGENLFAVDVSLVRSVTLRSDPQIIEVGGTATLQRPDGDLVIHSILELLGVAEADWTAVVALDCSALVGAAAGSARKSEFAIATSKCEVVKPVQMLTRLPRGMLARAHSPIESLISVTLGAKLELGYLLSGARLARALGAGLR